MSATQYGEHPIRRVDIGGTNSEVQLGVEPTFEVSECGHLNVRDKKRRKNFGVPYLVPLRPSAEPCERTHDKKPPPFLTELVVCGL